MHSRQEQPVSRRWLVLQAANQTGKHLIMQLLIERLLRSLQAILMDDFVKVVLPLAQG